MNNNELPPIPSAASTDSLEGMEGLERVDWSESPDMEVDQGVPESLTLSEWRERRMLAHGVEEPSSLICSVHLRQLTSGEEVDEAVMEAVARELVLVHEPEVGVVLEDALIVLELPGGVSWAAIATTVERAVVSQGLAATSVHAGFGLAEAGARGQSLDDALRLSRLAAAKAYAENMGVCELTLADEAILGRADAVAGALRSALEEDRGLRLVFQPKIDTGTQRFVGAEALLRFQCDELGEVGPSEFFPIAARAGLLERLERWVFENGIAEIARFASAHGLSVPVSINVRGADLLSEGFVEQIGSLLEASRLDPALLRVAVSEADIFARLDVAQERLEATQALGVSVALDDFGKEGSTLADLRRLPVDVVKVHKAFIRDLEDDPTAATLVQGVMSLARTVGIETVAVGVESWSQFESLRSLGCSAVQGFLFSPPLEADAFAARLREAA
ncbi:MAG: EAL domain-containing protein [Planctomycetota bacterium]